MLISWRYKVFFFLLEIQRLAWKAAECVKAGISRDALARRRLHFELLDEENLRKAPSAHPASALARLILKRAPFPQRSSFPLVSDGITAQFATATQPSEVGTLFDYGDLATAMDFPRLELVIRGGQASELVDSYMHFFMKALLVPVIGLFRGSWRSSVKWLGLVGRSVGVIPLRAGAPAHAG